jgi:predicted kinase
MSQFIIILHGPICSGKSTATELLMSRHKGLFRVSFDTIKRLISDYTPGNYRGVVNDILLALATAAFDKGFSLVVEGNVRIQKEMHVAYAELAKNNGIPFFAINIEAPLAILEERFKKRVASAAAAKLKISVTTLEGMMDRYDAYLTYKDSTLPLLDSSQLSSEEIVQKIESIVGLSI